MLQAELLILVKAQWLQVKSYQRRKRASITHPLLRIWLYFKECQILWNYQKLFKLSRSYLILSNKVEWITIMRYYTEHKITSRLLKALPRVISSLKLTNRENLAWQVPLLIRTQASQWEYLNSKVRKLETISMWIKLWKNHQLLWISKSIMRF